MLIAIPLLNERVAPRCIYAERILLAVLKYGRITERSVVPLNGNTSVDLVRTLTEHGVDAFICSGIGKSTRESLILNNIKVVENVTGAYDEILDALPSKRVKSGFGFAEVEDSDSRIAQPELSANFSGNTISSVDCLNCENRVCLRGEKCLSDAALNKIEPPDSIREMLESAMDVAFEEERKLCRLAELVYYCLGMRYKKLGVAFCIDLLQPASILTEVLKRFFSVFPVCCKIGGVQVDEDHFLGSNGKAFGRESRIACNPLMQAEVLNRIGVDMNIIVGLCVGADSVFTKASQAPVTTIFVKDKSLANNPIGAVYSDFYLNEI